METILKLYEKNKLSDEDIKIIVSAIDNKEIETDDIKLDFMDFMYDQLHACKKKYADEEIWSYTDEQYQNLLSHWENFNLLTSFLKENYY